MITLRCLGCGLTVAYKASAVDFCPRCLMRDRRRVKLIPVSDRPSSMTGRSMGSLSIHTTVDGTHHKISLTGELDVASAQLVEVALADACASGATAVVLDLGGVEFLDSMGLKALLHGEALCQEHRCEYTLTPAQHSVERVLRDTGVLKRLPFLRASQSR